jgi:predicted naringenin-chalcone synthase
MYQHWLYCCAVYEIARIKRIYILSKIISIGTAVPSFRHEQRNILAFMQKVYAMNEGENRKLKYLYRQSGIDVRYSVLADYSRNISDWTFYPQSENLEPFPSLEQRMSWYNKYAAPLSVEAISKCIADKIPAGAITHLITVSCTGMSAPGLDLQIIDLLQLPKNIFRTSINFMGCYAAIHALKIANAICLAESAARVVMVCTELCTLHFQQSPTPDNIASSLLFSDGSAAALITGDGFDAKGIHLKKFYAEILSKGKKDMAWELSSTGFLMTLSNYVPDLIEEDFNQFTLQALHESNLSMTDITHWCIHPGGKRILEAVGKSLDIRDKLATCYDVLREFGNMSSASILFVLERMMSGLDYQQSNTLFSAGFGPGLTLETFIAQTI